MTSQSVEERLSALEKRIQDLEQTISTVSQNGTLTSRASPSTITDLLSMPDSMQKTMMCLQEIREGTAADVAEKTGRNRSVETIYLNGLVRMGQVARERRGHRVYFKPMRYY
jgi:uncharacterized protein YhaN